MHQISIVVPGFLIIDPILEGIPKIALSSQRAVEEEATSSQSMTKEEEEIVEVFDSEDNLQLVFIP